MPGVPGGARAAATASPQLLFIVPLEATSAKREAAEAAQSLAEELLGLLLESQPASPAGCIEAGPAPASRAAIGATTAHGSGTSAGSELPVAWSSRVTKIRIELQAGSFSMVIDGEIAELAKHAAQRMRSLFG